MKMPNFVNWHLAFQNLKAKVVAFKKAMLLFDKDLSPEEIKEQQKIIKEFLDKIPF